MSRHLVALAMLVAWPDGFSNGRNDSVRGDPDPADMTYTLKLRSDRKGDKTFITEMTSESSTTTATGPKGKNVDSKKGVERNEFTETILDLPEGAIRPTKLTRAYRVAERKEACGITKKFSYADNTVLIKKQKDGTYAITSDGKPLPEAEGAKFREQFQNPQKVSNEDMLPAKAVKVNESWTLDSAVIKKLAKDFPLPVNAEKVKATGKLLRVYNKDDHRWGVIDLRIELPIEGTNEGLKMTGQFSIAMTLEAPVDGSSHDGTMKTKMTGKITGKGDDVEVIIMLEVDSVETHATAK